MQKFKIKLFKFSTIQTERDVGFIRDHPNAGLYNGSLVQGTPDGFGVVTFMPNDRFGRHNYTGSWRRGLIEGQGIIHWKNGAW